MFQSSCFAEAGLRTHLLVALLDVLLAEVDGDNGEENDGDEASDHGHEDIAVGKHCGW